MAEENRNLENINNKIEKTLKKKKMDIDTLIKEIDELKMNNIQNFERGEREKRIGLNENEILKKKILDLINVLKDNDEQFEILKADLNYMQSKNNDELISFIIIF